MMSDDLTLALDLGGTKQLACLVRGDTVFDRIEVATDPTLGPDDWLNLVAEKVENWRGMYRKTGIAVTGQVSHGVWNGMNPEVLKIGKNFPLRQRAERYFGAPVYTVNDAQAAAWGEYTFGAGQGRDMVFLTISTGIGGGIVLNDRLIKGASGLTGHFGQSRDITNGDDGRIEDHISGIWFAKKATLAGHSGSAKMVFEAAENGANWAEALITKSANRAAQLCQNIQWTFDPEVIVIGGSIGLSKAYFPRVLAALDEMNSGISVVLKRASLTSDAGVIGVADLANTVLASS